MLMRLTVRNFKSLVDLTVEFPRLAVPLDPNADGSNPLDDGREHATPCGKIRSEGACS